MGGLPGGSLYGLGPRLEHTVQVSVFKAGGDEGSRLAERAFLVASSPEYAPTCRTHPLPGAHPLPPVPGFIPDYPTPRPLWLRPAARDFVRDSQPPLCPAGAPLEKPARLGSGGAVLPLQALCCALAGGPKGGCWGWARLPLGGKFWVWVLSSWAHTAHVPFPCSQETPKKYESLPGPHSPAQPAFPASLHGAPPRRTASPTHFCSKAAMSLESRMFSSGSQVLYLPSHACRKAK